LCSREHDGSNQFFCSPASTLSSLLGRSPKPRSCGRRYRRLVFPFWHHDSLDELLGVMMKAPIPLLQLGNYAPAETEQQENQRENQPERGKTAIAVLRSLRHGNFDFGRTGSQQRLEQAAQKKHQGCASRHYPYGATD